MRRRTYASAADDCNAESEAGAAWGSRSTSAKEIDRWGGEHSDEDNSADEENGLSHRAAGKDQEPDMDENELGMWIAGPCLPRKKLRQSCKATLPNCLGENAQIIFALSDDHYDFLWGIYLGPMHPLPACAMNHAS